MSFQIKCSIAFATDDPFAAAPTWTDITTDSQGNPTVISFNTTRGRMHELDIIEPGSANILLNNVSGDFWPNNTGGSHYPDVIPLKRIKLELVYSATTYPLFEGLIEAWVPGWMNDGGIGPAMTLECVDVMAAMSRCETYDAFSAQASEVRIGYCLDRMLWTPRAGSFISGGGVTLQAEPAPVAPSTESINLVNSMLEANQAECGFLFVGKDGIFYFYNRDYLVSLTSQVTFSNSPGAGELPYVLPEFSLDSQYIYNDIRVINRGSTTIHQAVDLDSQALYGSRIQENRNIILSTEVDADWMAIYKQARLSQPKMRLKSLHLKDNAFWATNNIMPKAIQYDIPTRVTVVCAQASINEDYYIQGINLNYDIRGSEGGNLEVDLQLMGIERLYPVHASHTAIVEKVDADYATAHNAATGTAINDNPQAPVGQYLLAGNYTIRRGVDYFDVSGITIGETVRSADLWVYINSMGAETYILEIIDGALAHQPLVDTDYDDIYFGQALLGGLGSTTMVASQYNRIPLNAAGISWLQAQIDAGTTSAKLGLIVNTDINSVAPSGNEQVIMSGLAGANPPLLMVNLE